MVSKKLGHKIYRVMTILQKLADEAAENGDIDGQEYELCYWHFGVLKDMLALTQEQKEAMLCQQQNQE